MAEEREIFKRLRKLFSTNTIIRNVGGKKLRIVDTDQIQSQISRRGVDRYSRVYQSGTGGYGSHHGRPEAAAAFQGARLQLFRDYDMMDCLHGDTIIPLPDGRNITIKELSNSFDGTPFYVFSYDKEVDSVKLGLATKVWSKGIRDTVKITFDNGKTLILTPEHPVMMRDGSYKKAKDILPNESVMPFYQKDFYKSGYRSIYNFSKGWQSEHRLVAEQFYRSLQSDEVVHHVNFDKTNNLPDNLLIMKDSDHRAFHAKINNNIIWSETNRKNQIDAIKRGIINRTHHRWNGVRKGSANPFFGKQHSVSSNLTRSQFMIHWHNNNFDAFIGKNNPRYREDITVDKIYDVAVNQYKLTGKLVLSVLSKELGCDIGVVRSRITNWNDFKKNIQTTLNHKVVSVEVDVASEVFDMTVETYHNFATEHCFVHNCDPIIASVLDIYADECLGGETRIPLLNGTTRTIKDLYDNGETNFWVYSVDEQGMFVPAKCERVAYNGIKEMYKITLDDGTQIEATANHLWVTSDNKLVNTSELKYGSSLKVIGKKISTDVNKLSGYEMLYENKKWNFTHRLVANKIPELVKQRDVLFKNDRYIHHASFNKLNNDPSQLRWVSSYEHSLIHAEFNKKLWSDPEITHVYKEKIKKAHENYWTPERKLNVSIRQKEFMKKYMNSLTTIERKDKFGLSGKSNGMWNNGYKLTGKHNGRFRHDVNRDVNVEEYFQLLLAGFTNKQLMKKYNLLLTTVHDINAKICNEYKVSNVKTLRKILRQQKITISNIRHHIDTIKTSGKNPLRNLKPFLKKYGVSHEDVNFVLRQNGYTSYGDLITANNHRVVSVEYIGTRDAYDLVNVGSSHIYAIESNDGSRIFCHNCTVKDEFNRTLTIKTDNQQIQEILDNLFYDVLNIEFNLWPWIRNLAKYGDFFLYLDIDPEYGIVNVIPLSIYETVRIEGEDPENPFSVRFTIQNDFLRLGKKEFDNYEIAHFRLLSDTNFLPYGKAMIEGGRRVWKQLQLMEDAMLVHRIMRAPDKRKFKIDIGNLPPNEVEPYMQRIIDRMKKSPLVDPKTGDYNLRYNMMNIVEDFYLPVRGRDSGTDIETMQGLQFNAIEDIEYLRKKLLAAFKVPKSFIGYEEDINGKATLAAQDVRFARTIERIQRIMVSELTKIAIIHLYVQGFTDADLVNFEISLTNPSTLYEQEKITLWQQKFALAQQMSGGQAQLFSQDWVYKNILEMSTDQVKAERERILQDIKRVQEQQMAAQPPQPGMEPGGEMSPDATAEEPQAEETPPDEEQQIDDVEQILNSLSDIQDEEEPNEELEEILIKNKGGRPKEGLKFGTDKHPYGRDPLGHKENTKKYRPMALSMETKHVLNQLKQSKPSQYVKMITETTNFNQN